MVNFLSLLGWSPGEDLELMEKDVLIEKFSLDRIHPKSAVFDEKKLEWMNGQYFLRRDVDYFMPLVLPLWEKAGVDLSAFAPAYVRRAVELLKDRSKRLPDFVEHGLYFFNDPASYDEKTRNKHFGAGSAELLEGLIGEVEAGEFTMDGLEARYRAFAERTGRKGGDLIHPTRLAISGMPFGPGLFELMEALGKDAVVRRMRAAVERIRAGF
jgi:glutamyl-tRNA synthetase